MENIQIIGFKGLYQLPRVDFNAQTGICSIEGESFLEDTTKFYGPLLNWINEFISVNNKPITFNLKLNYFNTSTLKWILNILTILKKYEENGGSVLVNWYYVDDDSDIQDDIEDFIIDSGIKINLIPGK